MKKLLALFALGLLASCTSSDSDVLAENRDYKQDMRDFVIGISQYAKKTNPNFAIIPQNGIELVTSNGEVSGTPDTAYLNAIDGNGQEDLYFGYDNDNVATPSETTAYLKSYLDISKANSNTILAIDYCASAQKMDQSYAANFSNGYISFAANERNLNTIPNYPAPIYNENNTSVTHLSQVKNFLYLINAENFETKTAFINAVMATNYDALIMDLYFNDGTAFTSSEITQLKNKANGGKRIVIAYMSIGEAEEYRYYWKNSWNAAKPSWLDAENPDWAGNYKVKYWDQDWQRIIYGNDASYLKNILSANFDGVYLDIIDAFEYYE